MIPMETFSARDSFGFITAFVGLLVTKDLDWLLGLIEVTLGIYSVLSTGSFGKTFISLVSLVLLLFVITCWRLSLKILSCIC